MGDVTPIHTDHTEYEKKSEHFYNVIGMSIFILCICLGAAAIIAALKF